MFYELSYKILSELTSFDVDTMLLNFICFISGLEDEETCPAIKVSTKFFYSTQFYYTYIYFTSKIGYDFTPSHTGLVTVPFFQALNQ